MAKHSPTNKAGAAPFTDVKSVEPHYEDTVPAELIKTTAKPTPPGKEPMAPGSLKFPGNSSDKTKAMDPFRAPGENQALTTTTGVKIADNQNTLKVGERGPALLEDFHFYDKLQHFDRERIPERVVHARGSGAHGYFQVYESLAQYTKADFLQDPGVKTPVFVRISTVQGFRGSPDTVRDIRGFSTKFYTREGNFDLVGNDTAVFFIQDAIKFPDFIHAVKPEPNTEVPQGQTAHDSLYDYVSLQPETLHNIMWALSDRGIPRSLRTIEGFGIHTFRLVNAQGLGCFVRFHWKPVYGKASLIWDEAHVLTGRDPDFHRKDLWQAIEAGDYPEWELGLQIISEEEEKKFEFDILDSTKLIPEALVPVKIVGKMTLNRNPDNFFTETEQVAFCPANIVPGVEFSDDPLLQGRVFSYRDTQMHRLGGPNFNELPINCPICPVRNQQRDGRHRLQIDVPVANYEPNSTSGNWPREVQPAKTGGGFETYPQAVEGKKTRHRSASFDDYYSHPRHYWISLKDFERQHVIDAFSFELSKVVRPYIRERMVDHFTRICPMLAQGVADNLGITLTEEQKNRELPKPIHGLTKGDPTLSLYDREAVIKGRKVSLLVADGVSGASVDAIRSALKKEGVHCMVLAPHLGDIMTAEGQAVQADGRLNAEPSVLFDAVLVPDGEQSIAALMEDGDAKYHLRQAYKHLKAIGLAGGAVKLLKAAGLDEDKHDAGILAAKDGGALMPTFFEAMKQHRVWDREPKTKNIGA